MVTSVKAAAHILLVDDEPSVRSLVGGHLAKFYQVDVASSSNEALLRIDRDHFDLVIVDAHLEDTKVPEVIARARRRNPAGKTALLTGDSMDQCIRFAMDNDIGTLLARTIPFDLDGLVRTVKGLLTERVFGLELYLQPGAQMVEYWIRHSREIARVRDRILLQKEIQTWSPQRQSILKLALDESISNAAYHGNQIRKGMTCSFAKNQEVKVVYGEDNDKIGIAVVDQAGRLEKKTILQKLDNCISQEMEFLLADSGRGLYLMRSMVDRMIINIKKGVQTELIMLFRSHRSEIGQRPIIINEL